MKERKRILTLFGGIANVLIGIATLFISGYVLLQSINGTDPLIVLGTFGLIILFQIVFFLLALGFAISLIVIGAFEIRLGIYKNLEYSERTGLVIGFSIFEGILIILFIVAALIFKESDVLSISSLVVAIGIGISFLLKIIDSIIFKVYVKKGKIVLVQNSSVANAALLNVNLENLNNLNLSNNKENTKKDKDNKNVVEESKDNKEAEEFTIEELETVDEDKK